MTADRLALQLTGVGQDGADEAEDADDDHGWFLIDGLVRFALQPRSSVATRP